MLHAGCRTCHRHFLYKQTVETCASYSSCRRVWLDGKEADSFNASSKLLWFQCFCEAVGDIVSYVDFEGLNVSDVDEFFDVVVLSNQLFWPCASNVVVFVVVSVLEF